MSPAQRGTVDSGLDRALEWAQEHGFDDVLLKGSQFEGDVRVVEPGPLLPWQRRIGEPIDRPGASKERSVASPDVPEPSPGQRTMSSAEAELALRREAGAKGVANDEDFKRWAFKPNQTGIVVVHGIGPQLAGQTLLDWTRPIIAALDDAVEADQEIAKTDPIGRRLQDGPNPNAVTDPVFKANIDFSGETFPVLQVRIPRRRTETAEERAALDPLWVFTETWWASEVRPPTLRTMVGWLGEQGGVSRIVQGIQENTFGHGWLKWVSHISVLPFVSVIVSFVLLLLIAGLTLTKLIPIESIRTAAALKLASTFLTDWFGGARTLLRDPAQAANVRYRLIQTIKALRAYGCQRVVIIAHSGGTIVSLQTLTDPAYPDLHVDKLITIGEALNLGWRLESADPDAKTPTLPPGHRMLGNLARDKRLIWRDFFGTHDPAPSGPPNPPPQPGGGPDVRLDDHFATERTYNQMSILGDHGGYWDNDEHFVIPLIREIDVPTGSRTRSRFYSDKAESELRARRKERMSFLRLLRRGTNTMPIMAILAAGLLTAGGYLPSLANAAMTFLGSLPFGPVLAGIGDGLRNLGADDVIHNRDFRPFNDLYRLGLLVFQGAFTFAVAQALIPSFASGLWYKRPVAKAVILGVDLLLGPIVFGVILIVWWFAIGNHGGLGAIVDQFVFKSRIIEIAVGVGVFALLGELGKALRRELRRRDRRVGLTAELVRGGLLVLSAIFLAVLLVLFSVALFSMSLVFSGIVGRDSIETTFARDFVLGSIVTLLIFTIFQRVGGWRWSTWDVRERFTLRHNPLVRPTRWWVSLVGLLITAIVLLSAWLIAVGAPGAELPGPNREGWMWTVAVLFSFLILVTIGKDVVDNDVETDGGFASSGTGGRPSPGQVMPPPAPGP